MQESEVFKRQGFAHIKGLLSADEVAHYKALLQKISGLTDYNFDFKHAVSGYSMADGIVQFKEFWPLIYHEKLIRNLQVLMHRQPRFVQHADLHVHHGGVGWHRDNAYRTFMKGPDWDESKEEYSIVRVAIYLQSSRESHFKMGVIPGSHRRESFLNRLEMNGGRIYGRLTRNLPPFYLTVKPLWIPLEPGDCLIFDQRLLHTGTHIRGPKYSMYLGYGADDVHSRNHLDYYHSQKEMGYSSFPEALARILSQKLLLPDFIYKKFGLIDLEKTDRGYVKTLS